MTWHQNQVHQQVSPAQPSHVNLALTCFPTYTALCPPTELSLLKGDGGLLQAVNRGCRPMLCHHADWVAAFLHGQRGVSDWNSALKLGFEPATECWPDWLLAQVRT